VSRRSQITEIPILQWRQEKQGRKGCPNLAHESRLEVDLRIAAGGLASAGTIIVPQRKLINGLGHGIEDAGLATAIQKQQFAL
jgi:hypothetical protein